MTLTLRRTKGSALTYDELDDNFEFLGSTTKPAQGGGLNQVFFENDQTVTEDYTITSGRNAMSAGPITVDSNVTVTIPTGSVWTIV